jgi:hypothetical protein
MDQATIQRYQPGGDIYAALLAQHGQTAADACAAAALTGDETQINAVLALYSGTSTPDAAVPMGNTSTLDIFANQIATDPLAAPLDDANKVINNSILSFLKNPTVLFVVAVVLFFVFGGGDYIRRKMKGAN